MDEFIKDIRTVLTHTNATPFKCYGNQYFCLFCPANTPSFDHPADLRTHTRAAHPDRVARVEEAVRPHHYREMLRIDVDNLTCVCKRKAPWFEMLEHLNTKHHLPVDHAKQKIIPFRLTPNEMPCALCDHLSAFTSMDVHMNSHYNNFICGDCGDSFITATRLHNHSKIHTIGIYPCGKCDKMFSREMYRRKHVDMVHEKKPAFKCPHCCERFGTDKLRYMHMKEKHKDKLEIKARTCKVCNQSFSYGADYSRHMRRAHVLAYSCEECGKSFERKRLLDEHQLRHAGVKKYECDVCHKPYFSQAAVYMHKKCKHKDQMKVEPFEHVKVESISALE